jgi:hypothetical protein
MSDTCTVEDARVILPDLIEQVRVLARPVVLTGDGDEPVAALVPAAWLDKVMAAVGAESFRAAL